MGEGRDDAGEIGESCDLTDLHDLRERLRAFATARDWAQFHTPKNLAAALTVEAAELLEPFQWRTHGERAELDDATYQAVRMEMADVLLYLVQLADRLEVDLYDAAVEKIAINGTKYPAGKVKGDARKYLEY